MDELKFLQPILILSETKSFRKAAARLHVIQPALTKTIQNAEASYGVKLFDRSRAGVAPTSFGEIVVERARLLLQDAEALSRDIRTVAQLEGGDCTWGWGPMWRKPLKPRPSGPFFSAIPEYGSKSGSTTGKSCWKSCWPKKSTSTWPMSGW